MAKKMNFEDNLFYLGNLMKVMKEGLSLDIDAELFLDKTVDDIFFVDSALLRMYRNIRDNQYLLNRSERFRDMLRTEKKYVELMETILALKTPFTAGLETYLPKFQVSKDEHSVFIREIQNCLISDLSKTGEETDVISETEMRFLLSNEAENPGDRETP